ncbi:MAG: replication factor C small subunit [Candidatus Micrarchaeia archaeon]
MADSIYTPWTEKYRPKSLKEVIGQKDIIQKLQAYAMAGNITNLIFAGPAGTGKTTCALALARDIYGDSWRNNILELNASDERGIEVVRGKIKDFARAIPLSGIPFKIIFLDEADALTPEAQQALRRTMEMYSSNVRFILSANYSSRIIEPIQSRCAIFRFKPLTHEEAKEMIQRIAKSEKLWMDDRAVGALMDVAEGDMRKAINILQSISMLKNDISEGDIYKTVAIAKPEDVDKMLSAAFDGNFMRAREHLDNLLLEYGMSSEDILLQIYREVMARDSISEETKVRLADRIGEFSFRISEGANERIQLEALLAYLALIGSNIARSGSSKA